MGTNSIANNTKINQFFQVDCYLITAKDKIVIFLLTLLTDKVYTNAK